MNLRVTSTARRPQTVAESAAAIFVITQEDIRRSGVTSIPEALRMVPGVEVARIDGNKWAISARGFNGRFANKLQVMIDGRSVYTPLFSGVLWDVQDTVLEDIDRIEVVRGPGASLWGANAVNGVINIVTKRARDTQGTLLVAGGGTEEQGFSTVRYGGKFNDDTYYRAYAKYFNRDSQEFIGGGDAADDWQVGRTGFRMDWEPEGPDGLTVQGDFYRGVVGTTGRTFSLAFPFSQTVNTDDDVFGGNLLGRWTHRFADGSDMQLQVYYDLVAGDELGISLDEHTFDVDFQHHFQPNDRNDIVWGMGYRLNAAQFDGNFTVSFSDENRTDHLASAFFQDDITLVQDRLRLTLGSKFEYNTYTGFEIQPTARLLFTPDDRQSIWLAASRATRTPSQAEDSIILNSVAPPFSTTPPLPVPLQLSVLGNPNQDSEDVLAFELGYRVRPDENFAVDIATFYNIYDHLATVEPQPGFGLVPCPTPPFFVCAVGTSRFDNLGSAQTYGVEVGADIRPAPWWQIHPAYTFLMMDLDRDAGSADPLIEQTDGRNPRHQVSVRSQFNLADDWDFDIWGRYVSSLPERGVDSYFTFDARLAWRPTDGVELSIVGQNLMAGHHLESTPELVDTTPTEVERSVYGKITVTF
ncbi:MAG TPA: TonB-dependent receptor [Candidatus Acidoferrum sp.]|nr:TonB-dependent receptor [Candidatus Acidoferrum sp.]